MYASVGTYSAAVTASNSVSAQTETTEVTVTDWPISGLAATSDSPTQLGSATVLTASVSAGSNVSYTWDFGDGGTASEQNPEHAYAAPGTYMAEVTASNSVSSQTDTTEVTITDRPISGLLVANDSPTTLGIATTFTATVPSGSNVGCSWDFGDGGSDTGNAVRHTYPSVGCYTAVVTAANSVGAVSHTTQALVFDATSRIEPELGATLIFTDTHGLTSTVEVPGDAVTETVTLAWTLAQTSAAPTGLVWLNHAFDLDVYRDQACFADYTFQSPLVVTLHYSDTDVAGVEEDELALFYGTDSEWIDAATTCVPWAVYERHPDENWLAVPICHLTEFAWFGPDLTTVRSVYLPIILKRR